MVVLSGVPDQIFITFLSPTGAASAVPVFFRASAADAAPMVA